MTSAPDFSIHRIGTPEIPSPIDLSPAGGEGHARYVDDSQRVLYQIETSAEATQLNLSEIGLLEKAGPRSKVFFEPNGVHAALVTCGGLCPGLNNVIRAAVMTLWHRYGVRKISGIPFGYRGLLPDYGLVPRPLHPEAVIDIHRTGGTILGSSRGGGNRTAELTDTLERMGVNMLFTIGGDGTQRGALAIAKEVERRGKHIVVVGIPKTIDNDLAFVERSFGFETAVAQAVNAVDAAHTEARGAQDGIGVVKVMGRESGFIAAHTALATNDANYVLVPEVPFDLDGPKGLLASLETRLDARGHAVILVAEGAGQNLVQVDGRDASGNRKLGDIGAFLKEQIGVYFKGKQREITLKYIDPSYIIRAAAANPTDSIYCARLGANAVHAAMTGRTGCVVGLVNHRLVHVPIELATGHRNRVRPHSPLWRDVLETTGQGRLVA